MPTIRIEGGRVEGFEYRKTFEQLAGIKPPNLKVVQHDATAWFDSPHYAQVATMTNRPNVDTEQWMRELEQQAQMQRAIQQMNLNGQNLGVIPRSRARLPVDIGSNLDQVRAARERAAAHEARALLQAENDGLEAAAARTAMEHAVAPQDLADQGADQGTAMQVLQNLVPGQRTRARMAAGGRQGLELLSNAGTFAAPYVAWGVGQMAQNAVQNIAALPGMLGTAGGVGMQLAGAAARALNEQREREARDRAAASSSGGGARAIASGRSTVPAALANTPQGEAILREQIAELTARGDRMLTTYWGRPGGGSLPEYQAIQDEIQNLQSQLASFTPPANELANLKRRVRELEAEAEHWDMMGDEREAAHTRSVIQALRGDILHLTRAAP